MGRIAQPGASPRPGRLATAVGLSDRIRERFSGRREATDAGTTARAEPPGAATPDESPARRELFRRRSRRGGGRDAGVGATAIGGVRAFLRLVATIVRVVTGLIALAIVIAIVFKVTDANRDNSIVEFFFDLGDKLVGPFDGMFNAESRKTEVAINWGIAAAVWLFAGQIIARLLSGRRSQA